MTRKKTKRQTNGNRASVLVRIPSTLKEMTATIAQREGVSLNSWVTAAIIVYQARTSNIRTHIDDHGFLEILTDAQYVEQKQDIQGKIYTDWTEEGYRMRGTLERMLVNGIRIEK